MDDIEFAVGERRYRATIEGAGIETRTVFSRDGKTFMSLPGAFSADECKVATAAYAIGRAAGVSKGEANIREGLRNLIGVSNYTDVAALDARVERLEGAARPAQAA